MKLKAPPGVGDPCVAGVVIVSRDGIYEVEAAIGALLIEAFGFVAITDKPKVAPAPAVVRPAASSPPRRNADLPKLSLPAWRTKPAAKKP